MTNVWHIRLSPKAEKEFKSLDKVAQKKIQHFIDNKLMKASHPTVHGKRLTGPLKHLWRYRVGDYRILAHHKEEIVTILVVKIAHRSKVYR